MIGAGVGAAKVVGDPRPKTSTPKDVKTEMGARPKEKKPLSKSEIEISGWNRRRVRMKIVKVKKKWLRKSQRGRDE